MAHKTLIGGTAYEIGGGKTLVNGTAYSIDKGKTLVGGTAYEVGFGPPMVTVNLGSNVSQTRTYMYIDGVQYQQGTVDVPVGTILHCEIYEEGSYKLEDVTVKIHLNGTVVKSERFRGNGSAKITYDHTITTNTTVTKEFSSYSKCNIYIVES